MNFLIETPTLTTTATIFVAVNRFSNILVLINLGGKIDTNAVV